MSDYAVSAFWQYVKPGTYRTCDYCGVTQPLEALVRMEPDENTAEPRDICKDGVRCVRWVMERAK
jgi:hypothetical protein